MSGVARRSIDTTWIRPLITGQITAVPAANASAADRAYAYVRGEMLARRMAANELISEGQVADAVGVSRDAGARGAVAPAVRRDAAPPAQARRARAARHRGGDGRRARDAAPRRDVRGPQDRHRRLRRPAGRRAAAAHRGDAHRRQAARHARLRGGRSRLPPRARRRRGQRDPHDALPIAPRPPAAHGRGQPARRRRGRSTRRGCATRPTSTSGSPPRSPPAASAPSTPRSASTSTTPGVCWRGGADERRHGRSVLLAACAARDCWRIRRCAGGPSPFSSTSRRCSTARRSASPASTPPTASASRASQLSVFVLLQLGVYAAMQVPTGILVDRFGPRRLLIAAAATMAAGPAALRRRARLPDRARRPGAARLRRRADLHQRAALRPAMHFSARRFPVWSPRPARSAPSATSVATMPLTLALDSVGWTPSFALAASASLVVGVLGLAPPAGVRRASAWAAGCRDGRRATSARPSAESATTSSRHGRRRAPAPGCWVHFSAMSLLHRVRGAVGRAVPRGPGLQPVRRRARC